MSVDDIEIPEDYLCPISHEIMTYPVITSDGHTYEKKNIQEWLSRGKKISPLNGNNLSHEHIIDNLFAKKIINEFKNKSSKKIIDGSVISDLEANILQKEETIKNLSEKINQYNLFELLRNKNLVEKEKVIQDLKLLYIKLEQTNVQLKKENNDSIKKLIFDVNTEKEEIQKQKKQFEQSRKDLKRTNQILIKQNTEYEIVNREIKEENENLNKQIKEYKLLRNEIKEEIQYLKNQNIESKLVNIENHKIKEEKECLKKDNSLLEKLNKDMQKENENLKKYNIDYSLENSKFKEENQRLIIQTNLLKKELQELKLEKDSLTNISKQITQSRNDLKKENQILKSYNRQLEQENHDLKNQNENFMKHNNILEQSKAHTLEENEFLLKEISYQKLINLDLKEENEILIKQTILLDQFKESIQKENENLKKQLEEFYLQLNPKKQMEELNMQFQPKELRKKSNISSDFKYIKRYSYKTDGIAKILLELKDKSISCWTSTGINLFNGVNLELTKSLSLISTSQTSPIQKENGNLIFISGESELTICDRNFNFIENFKESSRICSLCEISKLSFAIGLSNGTMKILSLNFRTFINKKYQVKEYKFHSSAVSYILYLPSKNYILSCSGDSIINIFNMYQEKTIKSVPAHMNSISSLILLNDETFASGSIGEFKIWCIKSEIECIRTIFSHQNSESGILLNLVGIDFIASRSNNNEFKIWDIKNYECVASYEEDSKIEALIVTQNIDIITATTESKVNLWQISNRTNSKCCIY
jgi:hypothetical protein